MNDLPAPSANPPIKIHIAIPSRHLTGPELCSGLAEALWKMRQNPRYAVTVKFWPGFGLDVVRNQIVAGILASDTQFLIMVDDDLIPPDDLLEMAEQDCDIVGALCYGWDMKNGPFVVAYHQGDDEQYFRPIPGRTENTGLHEVAFVGGGCMMIHRRVLEALPAPWFYFQIDPDGKKVVLSEDFVFCQNAAKQGFKIFLDTDRVCGHLKKVDLRDIVAQSARRAVSPWVALLK